MGRRWRLMLVAALMVVGLLVSMSPSMAETLQWVQQFGTSSYDRAWGVAVDGAGNTYLAGETSGALPGQTSAGDGDAFVAKYDAAGNQVWVRQFGTSAFDRAWGVAVDGAGNAYLGGETYGALPGQTSAGGRDAFVAKYDAAGNQVWMRQFGGSSDDAAYGVAVDGGDNPYLAGGTSGALPGQTSAGGYDAFVAKYDAAGNQVWVRQFGGANSDTAWGVAVDGAGSAYLAGETNGALPGQTSAGGYDAFVAKYDAAGNQVWVRQFGGSNQDAAWGEVAVDSAGNPYVAGMTWGTLPGQTSVGADDAFLVKYDAAGNQVWTRQFGTASSDFAFGVAVDSADNPYVAGATHGTLAGQTSAGGVDAFVTKYDAAGNQVWARQFGGPSGDAAYGVAVDGAGNVYLAGDTDGSLPGNTSAGGMDAFVAKFQVAGNQPPSADAGSDVSGDEGAPIVLSGIVGDPDPGDSATASWSVDPGTPCSFADATAASTTITCTDNGVFTASLTANDGQATSIDRTQVSVDNLPPSITSINAPVDPVEISKPVDVSAPFTDDGGSDTHTCTIDWGDGTDSAGTVSGGTCTASHTYTAAGVYTLTVSVTDDDGDSDSELLEYVVTYDPSAGFVTGRGWIDSPTGAYAADPTMTGRANFGFVSKYKKGATVPDGRTQFQFKAAGMDFDSTAYEWLVVSGPKAQYKGTGTINGAGNYGFMLTINDGQQTGGGDVDRFRIKIWDKDNADAVVYDNQVGDADGAAASDAIAGGSIAIHTGKK